MPQQSRVVLASIVLAIVFLIIVDRTGKALGFIEANKPLDLGSSLLVERATLELETAGNVDSKTRIVRSPGTGLSALERAIWQVETGCREGAIMGDGGASRGPLQCGMAAFIDSGVVGRYEDVDRLDFAVGVMRAYWDRWCPNGSDEVKARVWNGGPRGAKKQSTKKYWQLVKQALDK